MHSVFCSKYGVKLSYISTYFLIIIVRHFDWNTIFLNKNKKILFLVVPLKEFLNS